mmetsp:Transcript_2058/g.3095  ORF Transcript_2058/g.3095 Transcript_2058/m.3095 type:complete len:92 (-) Transcript_2058:176-451(-)|eukprot:CAMPEP_0195518038 /NCGR_PEP_ID=MMETSP0794_2-20130614/12019_1 /TAXON_ID=515487 /ORGANISM="Stephanopyxis turris, Strain CCMP 815" /LENGTH=91 /DNA_ID=CAMNT_0040646937 /DNA_START=93 /DNA_END=368 /DNA_ORIENTATION=+
MPNPNDVPASHNESVGTLLAPTSDLNELSPNQPKVRLQKRVTVGTLLVSDSDLKTATELDVEAPRSTLIRRITERLQGPAPDDDKVEYWAD